VRFFMNQGLLTAFTPKKLYLYYKY
jgi:hypothetical protein